MSEFLCFIPIVVKSRQETGRVLPVKRGGKIVHIPVKSNKLSLNQSWLAAFINERPKQPPLAGPLSATIKFVSPLLKKHKGEGQWKTTRPDLDNLLKGLMDVLTTCGVIADDALVCQLHAEKLHDDNPGVEILITEMEAT